MKTNLIKVSIRLSDIDPFSGELWVSDATQFTLGMKKFPHVP